MSEIVSWGEVLWDRFPDGDELGGAPANVAFHVAALGADVALVSRVGADDNGRRARRILSAAGVDVACVQTDVARATGEVGIEIGDAGDARYTLYPGRAWERIECGAKEGSLLRGARAFCFGTLAQREPEGRAAHRAALVSLPDGAVRVCDPNLRGGFADWALLRESLAAADIVKINEHEADTIQRHLGCADAVAWLLDELGAELVALTRGANGCQLLHKNGTHAAHPGYPADSGGDNVGCGDAFTAALLVGLVRAWPLQRIAEAANKHAAFVAGRRGATPQLR